jgi:hypothetical protein
MNRNYSQEMRERALRMLAEVRPRGSALVMSRHNSVPCRVRDQAGSSVSDSSSQEKAEETARSSVSRMRKAVRTSE